MEQKLITSEIFTWQLPANKDSGSKIAGKMEGKRLANSVTEDVGGWALFSNSPISPTYSAKQQRSMGRRQRANQERGMNAKW